VRKLPWYNQPILTNQSSAGGLDSLLAIGCERDISRAGVSTVERPLGLAVANDEDTRGRHGDFLVSILSAWLAVTSCVREVPCKPKQGKCSRFFVCESRGTVKSETGSGSSIACAV
jgi:hypothetical protein